MLKFLRDAQSELEHVVWPTPNETKKYMNYNVVVIVIVTVLLMVLGYLIQLGLVAIRNSFTHEPITTEASDTITQGELDDITDAIERKKAESEVTPIEGASIEVNPEVTPVELTPEVSFEGSGVIVQ